MNPKVSIIMPVYNSEKFLKTAIDSVEKQTLQDVELICVDDGSTDNSLEILKKCSDSNPRIKVHSQKNQGSGSARNLALEYATGDFIVFLDSDDYYVDNTCLEKMYATAITKGVKVIGGLRQYDDNGVIKDANLYKELIKKHPDGSYVKYSDNQTDYHYTNYMYSRQLLVENNLKFPSYRRFQDPPFFVKTMIAAGIYYVIPTVTYCYRKSYKDIEWNEEKITGMLSGILDNIIISKNMQYYKLYWTCFQRINKEYAKVIRKYLSYESVDDILQTINEQIDLSLIRKNFPDCPSTYSIYVSKGHSDNLGNCI